MESHVLSQLNPSACPDPGIPWEGLPHEERGSAWVLPPPSPTNDAFPQGAEGPPGPTGQAGEPVSVRGFLLCLVQGTEVRTHGLQSSEEGITFLLPCRVPED